MVVNTWQLMCHCRVMLLLCIASTVTTTRMNQCAKIIVPNGNDLSIRVDEGNNAIVTCYTIEQENSSPIFRLRVPHDDYYKLETIRTSTRRPDLVLESHVNPETDDVCNNLDNCPNPNGEVFEYFCFKLKLIGVNRTLDRSSISCGYSKDTTIDTVTDDFYYSDEFLLHVNFLAPAPNKTTNCTANPASRVQNCTCENENTDNPAVTGHPIKGI